MKNRKNEPIIEEPDDRQEIDGRWFPFGGVFRNIGSFENFNEKMGTNGFYSEVKTFSSVIEYQNGNKVREENSGYHYVNDNGKEFMKVLNNNPSKLLEDKN